MKLQMLLETGLYILVAESCQKFLKLSDLTELEELDLPDNYLEELPTSINKLKNLKRLISEVNQLRELPQAIAELSNLTVLSVNNNQLSVLPSNIKHLKNLRGLYSSSNQSTTLPDEIGELKELEWLNERMETGDYSSKYENQLTTLPDEIGELKKLKVLLVAGNPVTLEEMVQVMKIQKISSHTYETGVLFHLSFPSSPGLT